MTKQINLTETLEQLNGIAEWFDSQTQVDVEEGLTKVKEAATLIKASKTRLKEIENEFIEIKADIQSAETDLDKTGDLGEVETVAKVSQQAEAVENVSPDDIPF